MIGQAQDKTSVNYPGATLTPLGAGNEGWPVRIRNLSRWGALLQSDILVSVGAPVVISRGFLEANGIVHHVHQDILGVRFEEPINAPDWYAELEPPSHACLAGQIERFSIDSNNLSSATIETRIREELAYVSRLLDIVTQNLSDDPFLRARYKDRIEELCTGNQMLRELTAIFEHGFTENSVEAHASGPMRQRLLRKRLV